ncbi:MAG: amino acid adenylation domain-containing protein, partial [Gammaproteobacteria bacterium]
AAAVVCGTTALSYRALKGCANRVAHALIGCGVGPEVIVAVLDERGIDLLVAILAILKAGGVYLPLDPSHPEARWLQVLRASRAPLVLVGAAWRTRITGVLAQLGEPRSSVAILAELAQAQTIETDPPRRGGPRDLAYIIFTSGSTGVPKGAMVERQGMFNNLMTKVPALGLTATDVIAQTASQCFDISVWQFLTALLCGARVEILPDPITQDPRSLLQTLNGKGVTILESVPSMIQAMLDAPGPVMPLPTLRWLLPTGEACPPELCRRWRERYPHVALLNAYGPAECADDVAYHRLTGDDETSVWVPIGRPVDNMRLYILDRTLQPASIHVPGELCAAGVGVGRGYLKGPDLTAAAFIPDPFGPPGTRLYRTGDLARYRGDGAIEFLGRVDHQVKIRGYRIELGEIETQLALHPAVKATVVAVHEPVAGDRQLAAYVIPRDGVSKDTVLADALRSHLRAFLPDYMVPSAFVFLDALPLTPNGKVDRKKLPEPEWAADTEDYIAPRTPTEEILAGIWSEVLGVEGVAVHDHFFELGGHSLLATQVIARIANAFAVELPLRSVFEAPTVAQLAATVDAAAPGQGRIPPIIAAARDKPLSLSYAQSRLWFMTQLDPDSPFYHFPTAVRFTGQLDIAAVESSINAIIGRHAVLRTVFVEHGGEPAQVVLPELTVALPVEDLTSVENREAALQRRLTEENRLPFD